MTEGKGEKAWGREVEREIGKWKKGEMEMKGEIDRKTAKKRGARETRGEMIEEKQRK